MIAKDISIPWEQKNGQVGVATVGEIEKAGGKIHLDGVLNSLDGRNMANHAARKDYDNG